MKGEKPEIESPLMGIFVAIIILLGLIMAFNGIVVY